MVERLKKEPGKDIIVEGGPSLAHDLIQRRLADDYKMLVMPVIYGKDPHYWGTTEDQESLRLISVKKMPQGELILHYASVRQTLV